MRKWIYLLWLVCWGVGGFTIALTYVRWLAAAGAYGDVAQAMFALALLSGLLMAVGCVVGLFVLRLTFVQVEGKWVLIEKEKVGPR